VPDTPPGDPEDGGTEDGDPGDGDLGDMDGTEDNGRGRGVPAGRTQDVRP
jgi:hypothetical protein